MKYPEFINKNDTIGITALSAGMGSKLDEHLEAMEVLKDEGYLIKESPSVRVDNKRANTAKKRAKELDDLILDQDVKMIMEVTGGDYQLETMPYINFKHISENPKWLMGYSDPTNLLFTVTCGLDIATLYGLNGSSYTKKNKLEQVNNLKIISGNIVKQKSFKKYQDFIDVINENPKYSNVYWKSKDKLETTGRCIGGCFDVIAKLIGTEYDHVNEFIERYKDDGIIWYFDNFAMSSYDTYLTLLQFKYAGYFKYCKAVLIGRVAFPNISDDDIDYEKAYKLALKGIPYVSEMDIGHSQPRLTMINGAMMKIKIDDGKGEISFTLK